MDLTVFDRPQEMVDMFKAEFVAPIVGYLTSKGEGFGQLGCTVS
jgi:hypothetical protein